MQAVRVGVVMGGVSCERETSLQSGVAVTAALQQLGYEVLQIDLGSGSSALASLANAPMDVAFLALQGAQGEDGVVQGILEMLGVPYTGSGVLGSALATDKLKSKELFRLHNVPTPVYYELTRAQAESLHEVHGSFGYPVNVRPRREGVGVGVFRATSAGEFSAAVDYALQYDDAVLVERSIQGREVAVGLLDGRVLGAVEMAAGDQPNDSLGSSPLAPTRIRGLLNLAERAAEALDVRGPVQVNLLVTDSANEYVLEVDPLPELVPTSPWVRIAAAAGYDFPAMCEAVLRGARLDNSCVRPAISSSVVSPELGALPGAELWTGEESFDFADCAVVTRGSGRRRAAQRSA